MIQIQHSHGDSTNSASVTMLSRQPTAVSARYKINQKEPFTVTANPRSPAIFHGTGKKDLKIWVLRPFQECFAYIEPIVNQRWTKTEKNT